MVNVAINERPHVVYEDFALGLLRKAPKQKINPRAALVSEDVIYDEDGAFASRPGYTQKYYNPIDAVKVANFESGESWTGNGVMDTTTFYKYEAENDGAQSRKFVVPKGSTHVASLTGTWNLGDEPHEHINLHFYLDEDNASAITNFNSHANNYIEIKLITSSGNYFYSRVTPSDNPATQTWFVFSKMKKDFEENGSPDWTNITQIDISVNYDTNATGDANLTVYVDNITKSSYLCTGLYQYRRRGFPRIVMGSAGTKVRRYNEETKRWLDLITGREKDSFHSFVTFGNLCFITNGKDANKKFDGENVSNLGLPEPEFDVELVGVGSGNVESGIHYYAYTWVAQHTLPDGDIYRHEGTPKMPLSDAPSIEIASNSKIKVTRIEGSPDEQITHWRLYRRPSTSGIFRRVGEYPIGNSTIEDNLSNNELSTELEDDNDKPPVLKKLVKFGAVLLGFGDPAHPGYLYVCKTDRPDQWPADYVYKFGDNDDDEITMAYTWKGFCFVSTRDSYFIGEDITIPPYVDFGKPISMRFGSLAPYASDDIQNHIYFLGEEGDLRMSPRADIVKTSELAFPHFKNEVNLDQLKYSTSAWSKNRYLRMLTVPWRGSKYPNRILAYDYHARNTDFFGNVIGAWTIFNIPATFLTEIEDQDDLSQVIFGTRGAFVYQFDEGHNDNGYAFTFTRRTPWMNQGIKNKKRYADLEILASPIGNFNLTLKAFYKGSQDVGFGGESYTVNFTSGASLGDFVLGTSKLGGPEIERNINLLLGRARNIQLEFSGLVTKERFSIFEYTLYFDILSQK